MCYIHQRPRNKSPPSPAWSPLHTLHNQYEDSIASLRSSPHLKSIPTWPNPLLFKDATASTPARTLNRIKVIPQHCPCPKLPARSLKLTSKPYTRACPCTESPHGKSKRGAAHLAIAKEQIGFCCLAGHAVLSDDLRQTGSAPCRTQYNQNMKKCENECPPPPRAKT